MGDKDELVAVVCFEMQLGEAFTELKKKDMNSFCLNYLYMQKKIVGKY